MIGRQSARLIFCALALSAAASGSVIITSGTVQTSLTGQNTNFIQTAFALDGAGFSTDLGPFGFTYLNWPHVCCFLPVTVNFNFTQQAGLSSQPLSSTSTVTYNGTTYGDGYTISLALYFFGPAVRQQASCSYYGSPPVSQSCSVDWTNVPFAMNGTFSIVKNGVGYVVRDTVTGSGLASASDEITAFETEYASVRYVFTTPEPSSLVLAAGGLISLGVLRRAVRRRRLQDRWT